MSPAKHSHKRISSGMREAKKLRARARMIDAAITLFREQGYETTRVYDITRAADLSEATFFNYFPSKDAVLGAWMGEGMREAFDRRVGDAATGSIRRPVREAVREIAGRLEGERELLVQVWPRLRPSGGEGQSSNDVSGVEKLLAAAQGHGHLRRDVSPRQLAEILQAILFATATGWLAEIDAGEAPKEDLSARMLKGVNLLLDGSRRRNERVHPQAATRTR